MFNVLSNIDYILRIYKNIDFGRFLVENKESRVIKNLLCIYERLVLVYLISKLSPETN